MRNRCTTLVGLGLMAALLAAPSLVRAQAAAPKPAAPVPAPAKAPPPPPAEPYTYDASGRRDPFVSLVSHGVEAPTGKRPGSGLAGLSTAELMVKGVMLSRGAYIALVAGPDGKTYTVHVNDRIVDGTIRSITAQGLVIMQEVNDPLSLIKQKEVRKGLRSVDDAK